MQQLISRLELLKNLMVLQEQELVRSQIRHLHPYVSAHEPIKRLIAALTLGRYGEAQALIGDFLKRQHGLVSRDAAELAVLQLELSQLEGRKRALVEEQAEHQGRIDEFNLRHHRELSQELAQVLLLRRQIAEQSLLLAKMPLQLKQAELRQQVRRLEEEIARLQRESEQAEHEDFRDQQQAYQESEQDYEQYQQQQADEEIRFKGLDRLDDEQLKQVKKLYRRACKLAHPDLVADELRDQAHSMMVAINQAKDSGDLAQLEQLLLKLESGHWQRIDQAISDLERLRQHIANLHSQVSEQEVVLQAMRDDPELATILDCGNLDDYFAEQKVALSTLSHDLEYQAAELTEQLAAYQAELYAIDSDSTEEEQ